MIFFIQGYYRGITGALCVIFLQLIGFSLNRHNIDIWTINTHSGEKCSLGAQIPNLFNSSKVTIFPFYVQKCYRMIRINDGE